MPGSLRARPQEKARDRVDHSSRRSAVAGKWARNPVKRSIAIVVGALMLVDR
jgi:hypothetical protein